MVIYINNSFPSKQRCLFPGKQPEIIWQELNQSQKETCSATKMYKSCTDFRNYITRIGELKQDNKLVQGVR